MKRFLNAIVFGVMLLCSSAIVHAVVMEYMGPDGVTPVKVSATNPLPGSSGSGGSVSVTNLASTSNGLSVSLGAQVPSVAPKGATSIVGGVFTVTTSPASWTMTASATDFVLKNLGATTVWCDFNSGGATVSAGLPLTATGTIDSMLSRDAAQGVVVWLVASESTVIYRAEGRR